MSTNVEAEAIVHELFLTEAGRRDPHPRFHRLRDIAPVHRSEALNAWVLTRFEDCKVALRDPRFEKRFAEMLDAASSSWRRHPALVSLSQMMLQLDAPEHTRLRGKVARSFITKTMLDLRPRIEQTVADLLVHAADDDADLLEDLAFTLPITVIGDLLGIARELLPTFRAPTLALTRALDVRPTREQLEAADRAAAFFNETFRQLVADQRNEPGDGLPGILACEGGDDPLTDRELVDMCTLLLVAGFETTTNTIGGGLLALHDQPEQFALLRSSQADPHVVDEFLRYHSAVSFINRVTVEDVGLGGATIAAGDTVLVMLAAANRDPAVFDEPDRLDVTRSRPRHLAFGGGIHHCLGAALARLELEVLFEQLAARFESVEGTGVRASYRDSLVVRAVESLPLRLRPTAEGSCPVTGARPAEDDTAWRDEQRTLLEANPPTLTADDLAARVRLLESQPLFAACRPSELESLAATAYVLSFEDGDAIVTQGRASDDVYLLLEGDADVHIDGERVGTVTVDDLVGERGAVTETPRAATVMATTHVAALVLSRARFAALLGANPTAAVTMRAVVDGRYPAAGTRS